jgi:hypothetical protein
MARFPDKPIQPQKAPYARPPARRRPGARAQAGCCWARGRAAARARGRLVPAWPLRLLLLLRLSSYFRRKINQASSIWKVLLPAPDYPSVLQPGRPKCSSQQPLRPRTSSGRHERTRSSGHPEVVPEVSSSAGRQHDLLRYFLPTGARRATRRSLGGALGGAAAKLVWSRSWSGCSST